MGKIAGFSLLVFGVVIPCAGKEAVKRRGVKTSVPFPEVIKTQTTEEKIKSLRLAIEDIESDFGSRYDGEKYLSELKQIEKAVGREAALELLQKRALLANPALDFEDILVLRRRLDTPLDRTSMGRAIGMSEK